MTTRPQAVRPRPHQSASTRWARWTRSITPYTFVLPVVVFLAALIAFPVFFNLRISFYDLRAVNLLSGDAPWVGLDNYRAVLANPLFHQAVRNTLLFTAGSIAFQLSIGLALALYYHQRFPGASWMRGLYLIAWTVPAVSVAAVFRWLFEGQVGAINHILNTVGILDTRVLWLTDPSVALGAVTVVNVWLGIPFNMALLLAALQGIPAELYEAADIDGANGFAKTRLITVPLLRPAIFAVLLLGLIYTFKVFDVVWATTQGGPFNATHLVSTLAYRQIFGQFRFGPGAAMLNLLFVVLLFVAFAYLWNLRHEEGPA